MDGENIRKVAEAERRIQAGKEELRKVRARVRELTSAKRKYEDSIAFSQQQVQFYLRKLKEHKVSNI